MNAAPIEAKEHSCSQQKALPNNQSTKSSSTQFIHVEKNLASLGFFTPSTKKIKGAKKKIVLFSRDIGGRNAQLRAVILPSAEYGLPVTSDQDKYLALQKIITDIRQRFGAVTNPVGFTSAQLLRILGLKVQAGKNYDEIADWAKRMTLTGICSEGVVYFAGKKNWASDTFHVFERFVSYGKEMPDGTTADRNYVWLSEWQLENINHNFLLPIDFEAYKQLRNHIAKALVPLLQIWLYATRAGGCFEKRYDDLCQILNIRQYPLDRLISVLAVSKLKPGFLLLLLMPGPIRSFSSLSLTAGFKVFRWLYVFPDQADVQSRWVVKLAPWCLTDLVVPPFELIEYLLAYSQPSQEVT